MSTKFNVGVIGLGVGEAHVEGFLNHEACTVKTICDFSPEKLKIVGEKFPGILLTKDADKVLEDPDIQVVAIASYDNFHHAQIIKALDNNKHVFAEKPVCLNLEEAKDIRKKLKEKKHLRLSSNLILRQVPRFRSLRNQLKEEKLGKIYYFEGDYNYGRLQKITEGWRGQIPYYSVVLGGGIHLIDLMHWLTGLKVEEVFAWGNQIVSKGTQFRYPDCVVGMLKLEGDVLAKITSNYSCVRPHFHNLNLFGTEGTYIHTPEEGQYYLSRDPLVNYEPQLLPYPGVKKGDLIKPFVDNLLGISSESVTEDEIFQALSVAFALEKAQLTGQKVLVEYV